MLKKLNKELLKDIIYYHYINDNSFPRSCDSVSRVLTVVLHDSDLKDEYEISCVRGHYRNDYEKEFCDCEDAIESFNRFSNLGGFECMHCDCDYFNKHSWIELKHLKTNEITILDFTRIQFEEDFCDYHQEIIDSDYRFSEEDVFDYLNKNSEFVIEKCNKHFNKYIKSERVDTGSELTHNLIEDIKNKKHSPIGMILECIGYKFKI